MGYLQNHLYSRIDNDVATNDGDGYTLDNIGRILDATIYTLLTALADAMHWYSNQSMSDDSKAAFTSSNFVLRIIASIFFIPFTLLN